MAKFGKGNPGRPKGAINKATTEIRDITQRLFDAQYWDSTRRRLLSGRLAPAVEAKLLAYAFGEPKQTHQHEIAGVSELAKKVIYHLQPGPTKAA